MYDKLVEALRLCAKYGKAEDALANAQRAADAIEVLNKMNKKWEEVIMIALDLIPCEPPKEENDED